MSPRQCVTVGFRLRDTRTDGRFFDSLRMTCVPIGIVEMYLSFCLYCRAEEAGVKVGQTFLSARLGKSRRFVHLQTLCGGHIMTAESQSRWIVSSFCACGSDSVTRTPEPPALERGLQCFDPISMSLRYCRILIAGGYAEPPTKVEDPSAFTGPRVLSYGGNIRS